MESRLREYQAGTCVPHLTRGKRVRKKEGYQVMVLFI